MVRDSLKGENAMSVLFAAFLGLVQGIAEFLPISSSGHLAIFQTFFHMENVEESQMLFDVLLHLGTLVSVCIVYRNDIVDVVKELWVMLMGLFGKKTEKRIPVRRLILLVILSTVPLVLAVVADDFIEALYSSTLFIGIALLCTGTMLYLSDKLASGHKTEKDATWVDALLVGVMQAVAVLPGISRSGSTITAGLVRGFDRKFAVRYSFLLSIPAIVGANILKIGEAVKAGAGKGMFLPYAVGMIVAAVSGYFAIKLVKLLMDKGKFGRFSYYCWAVGLLTIVLTIVL